MNGFFLSGGINVILYILLAAVFLFCLIRSVAPLTASRQALLRGSRAIRKGEKSKRSWREEGFLGGAMQARWSAFLKNQTFLEEQFGGSAKVEDFIGEDEICPPESAALAEALAEREGPTIAVSNEVGLSIVPENALARRFRDAQGRLNQMVAARAGTVIFMVAGLPMRVKG